MSAPKINTFIKRDWLSPLRFFYHRLRYGYDDRDVIDPRKEIEKRIAEIHVLAAEFAQYEMEFGKRLPKDFSTDPAAWMNVLRDIEYSTQKDHIHYLDPEKFSKIAKYLPEMYEFDGGTPPKEHDEK